MSKSIEEVKKSVKKFIRLGYDKESICGILSKNDKSFDSNILKDVVEDVVQDYPNYGMIQKIVRSELVVDKAGEDVNVIILDSKFKSIEPINRQRLFEMFDSKYDFKSKVYTATFDYRPLEPGMLLKNSDGSYSYNTYVPPKWLEEWFYSKGEIQPKKVSEIPTMYYKFFNHLVGGNKPSFDYLIKWLANGLKRKNYCILTTIGKQGIGKGVLGEIMRKIFGRENYYAGSDRMFKGTFNSQIANRRLVYCDEIFIREKEDEDKLKLVVNDNIEIEKKGVDAKEIKNYANFYVSSNNMDAICLTADDRRFSIIDLTDVKLLEIMSPDEIKELLEEKNVEMLARFLWYVNVDVKEMSKVFITERTSQVRAMGLKEWEEYFIMEYCPNNPGKVMKVHEAGEVIKDHFGYNTRVGRGRFLDLQNKYPESFKVTLKEINDKKTWVVEILSGK